MTKKRDNLKIFGSFTIKPSWIKILSLLFILTTAEVAQGTKLTERIVDVSCRQQIFLGPYIEYFEDPQSRLDIKQVANPAFAENFKSCSRTSPGFGFTSSTFWFRFSLRNNAGHSVTRFLEIEYPLLDYINLYAPDGKGSFQVFKEGDRQSFFQRPIKYRNFVFVLDLPPKSTKTYYLQVNTSSSLNLPARLYSQAGFMDKIENEEMALGIYFGILFAMLAYNLILFFTIRESVYLYYVLFVIFYFLFQLDLTGVAFKYLWPNNTYWANESLPFFIFVAYMFGTIFTKQIINAKSYAPFLDKILSAFMILSLICAAMCLLVPYEISIKAATLVTMTVVVHILAGFLCFFRGYRPARYYASAWSVSMAGAAIYALKSFGLLPNNFITVWGIQMGSAWEVILLSMALSDRLSLLQKEKDAIQAEYTRKLEEANLRLEEFAKTLEEKVRRRTRELERSNALLKRQAEEMRMAEERAERASKAKSDFLANMSHEIRTPLNAITGITSLALDMELPEKLREYLKIIKVSAYALLNLVNDILDFSKIEAGKMELEKTDFSLVEVIENIADMFTELVAEESLEFIINIESNVPDRLIGDPVRLGQLITNLVSNAIKFTDHGEIVLLVKVVSENKGSPVLCFKVSDTGIGIEKDRLDYLFDMFTQADSSTTRRFGGTGLGLTICKRIAQLMGGTINVESEPSVGTTFTFTVEMEKSREAYSSPELKRAELGWSRLLISTQNSSLKKSIGNILKRLNLPEPEAIDIKQNNKTTVPSKEALLFFLDSNKESFNQLISTVKTLPENSASILLLPFGSVREIHGDIPCVPCFKPVTVGRIVSALDMLSRQQIEIDKESKNERIRFQDLNVLVVEDNEINQMVAREILEKFGARIEFASNGAEALSKATADIDIIFMDIQMPKMDGYEATKALRQLPEISKTPIVAMTAGVFKEDRQRCFAAGMNDFLMKPITPESVLSAIKKWADPSKLSYETEVKQTRATSFLPAVPGADMEEAKKRFDTNPDLYLELVSKFAIENSDIIETVSNIRRGKGAKNLKQLFHTLKGVCANLALNKLRELFYTAENMVQQNQEDELNKLLIEIKDHILAIKEYTSHQNGTKTKEASIIHANDAEIKNLIVKLDELLELNDIDCEDIWREIKKRLKDLIPAQDLAQLDGFIDDLDFDAARHKLAQINSILQ